jgi:hypothetical protein
MVTEETVSKCRLPFLTLDIKRIRDHQILQLIQPVHRDGDALSQPVSSHVLAHTLPWRTHVPITRHETGLITYDEMLNHFSKLCQSSGMFQYSYDEIVDPSPGVLLDTALLLSWFSWMFLCLLQALTGFDLIGLYGTETFCQNSLVLC